MKRVLLILLILAMLAGGAAAFLFLTAPGRQVLSNLAATAAGQNLQNYLAGQIVKIVNTYVEPEIAFEELTYVQPGTIHLDGVTFTADDGTQVIACRRMTVRLAEVPRVNEPINIEAIVLEQPALRLIQTTGPDGQTGFKGLVPFVKRENIRDQEAQSEDTRLSTILDIRELRIVDALIEHREEGAEQAMILDDIDLSLNAAPDNKGDPGVYVLDSQILRAPLFDLKLRGRLNIDTFVAELEGTELDMTLSEDNYGSLPVVIQNLLLQHQARGRLWTTLSGIIDLRSPLDADLAMAGRLDDFNLTFQTINTPVNKGTFSMMMKDRLCRVPELAINTMGGDITISDLRMDLGATDRPASARWVVKHVDLDKFFRAQEDGTDLPKIKGILSASGKAAASTTAVPQSLSGSGELSIIEGQLIRIPFITDLAEAMNVLGHIRGKSYEPRDKLDITFTLTGEGVDMSKLNVETNAVVARGKGTIFYNSSMDLLVNAGPMEKIQSMLGQVGDILGAVTDRLVKYRVHGPLDDPKVTVKPLGL